ncbi:MAG TPA: motility protein A [Armatimonadetes bacterium]|nr:motility protein A [Armatimonadota bacterium]
MDLATAIGLLLAFGCLVLSVCMEGGSLAAFINLPAAVLVCGGTIGATIICFPLSQILKLPGIARNAFLTRELNRTQMIDTMVGFAQKARREGLLVLEDDVARVDHGLLRLGVELAVDGTPQERVRDILTVEIDAMHERHQQGEQLFATMGAVSPKLGIIGTLIGVIHMLGTLTDPKQMGPALAGAFIATLYGVAFANLVALPIAAKLRVRGEEEAVFHQMILEGLMAIQSGDNPRAVEMKMRAFLSPEQKVATRAREA